MDSIKTWVTGILTLLIVGCFSYLIISKAEVEKELIGVKATRDAFESTNTEFDKEVKRLTQDLEALKLENDQREAEAKKAMDAASQISDKYQDLANHLQAFQSNGNACESGLKVMYRYMEGLK